MTWITPYSMREEFTEALSLNDKIRILKERTLGWQLDIADACINGGLPCMKHSGFAVLFIVFSYFETIANMKHGVTKNTDPSRFFKEGVLDVFPELNRQPYVESKEDILTILYRSARCGFYHSSMARQRISICGEYEVLEYDRIDKYVKINPHKLIPRLKNHFLRYVLELLDPQNVELRRNFETTFEYLQDWDPLKSDKAK